ncbi:hypothetical protein JCM8547_004963 [Rhodosporidiobolus lusitaniae]
MDLDEPVVLRHPSPSSPHRPPASSAQADPSASRLARSVDGTQEHDEDAEMTPAELRTSALPFVAVPPSSSPSRLERLLSRFSPPSLPSPFSSALSARSQTAVAPSQFAQANSALFPPHDSFPHRTATSASEAFRRRPGQPSGAVTPAEERELASQLSFSLRRGTGPGGRPPREGSSREDGKSRSSVLQREGSAGPGGDGGDGQTSFRLLPDVRMPAAFKGKAGKGKERHALPASTAAAPDEDEIMVDDEACFVDGWEGKVDFLVSLPFELSLNILLNLAAEVDYRSILACTAVSHHWRALALDPLLWRELFHRYPGWALNPEVYEAAAAQAQAEAAAASISRAGTPTPSSPAAFLTNAASNYFDAHKPPLPPSLKRAASSFSRAASASSAGAKRAVVAGADRMQSSGAALGRKLSEIAGDFGGVNLVPGGGAGGGHLVSMSESDSGSAVSTISSGASSNPPRPGTPRRLTTALAHLNPSSSTLSSSSHSALSAAPTALLSSPTTTSTSALASLPSTSTLSTAHAFASPPSATGTLSRTTSSTALSTLSALPSSSLSALSSPAQSRRSSRLFPPSSSSALSPSLPSAPSSAEPAVQPMKLDWPRLFRDRHVLDRRWDRGKASWSWLEGHGDSVYCVQFDAKGGQGRVVSGSRDRTIRIWDLASGTVLRTLTGHEGSVLCLQYDNDILVSGSSDSRILVWDLQSGKYDVKMQIVGHAMGVLDLCFDKDWIVSCSKDTTTRVWHRSTGALYRTLSGHRGPVNAVQLHGSHVLSASGDALMKLWDLHTGQALRTFTGHSRGLACVHWAPSGKFFVSGSNDKTMKLWDAESGECVMTFEGHGDLVRSLWYDEKKERVVSASYDRTTRVWDARTGQQVQKFKSHASLVFDVAFDASRIVSCSHDQRILVMDFGEGLDVDKFA